MPMLSYFSFGKCTAESVFGSFLGVDELHFEIAHRGSP